MSILSRLRARRFLDAAAAERLLAGRGVPGDAPAGQQVLARALELISGPGSEEELAGEVVAAAVFVRVPPPGQAGPGRGGMRLGVGGTAVYGVLSPDSHKAAPLPLRVPSPGLAVSPSRIPRGAPRVSTKGHRARHSITRPLAQVPRPTGRPATAGGAPARSCPPTSWGPASRHWAADAASWPPPFLCRGSDRNGWDPADSQDW
jgi:hypothetical protein